jgi:hypothetical protein
LRCDRAPASAGKYRAASIPLRLADLIGLASGAVDDDHVRVHAYTFLNLFSIVNAWSTARASVLGMTFSDLPTPPAPAEHPTERPPR